MPAGEDEKINFGKVFNNISFGDFLLSYDHDERRYRAWFAWCLSQVPRWRAGHQFISLWRFVTNNINVPISVTVLRHRDGTLEVAVPVVLGVDHDAASTVSEIVADSVSEEEASPEPPISAAAQTETDELTSRWLRDFAEGPQPVGAPASSSSTAPASSTVPENLEEDFAFLHKFAALCLGRVESHFRKTSGDRTHKN